MCNDKLRWGLKEKVEMGKFTDALIKGVSQCGSFMTRLWKPFDHTGKFSGRENVSSVRGSMESLIPCQG